MFNWLTVVFKKTCWRNCPDLNSLCDTLKSMKKENCTLSNKLSAFSYLQDFNDKRENILFIGNLHDVPVFVTVEQIFNSGGKLSELNFYAYVEDELYGRLKRMQTLYTEISYNSQLSCFESVHIIDFVGAQNQGFGSLVMEQFLDYIKQFGCKQVTGWLSPVDADHKDLLLHFYTKFGFEIKKHEDKEIIVLRLK